MMHRPASVVLIAWLALAAAWPAAARAAGLNFALPATAFATHPACPLDPFAAQDAYALEQRLSGRCRGAPALGGASVLGGAGHRATWRLDHQLSLQAWEQLVARVRLRLNAAVDAAGGNVQPLSGQAELAAGLWWQPTPDWAMHLGYGQRTERELTVERTELTGAWRLSDEQMVFTRWTGLQDDTALGELGLRWWLVPRAVSFDLAVPARLDTPDGARLRLSWRGFSL